MTLVGRAARRLCVGAAALALVAALASCSTSGDSASGTKGYISGPGVVVTVKPADRSTVPEVKGEGLSGNEIDLSDYRGKVIVLNVWASWCPPCRAEIDDVIAAHDKLPDVEFIGVNNRDERSAAEAFVRVQGVPYDSLYDESGAIMLDISPSLRPDSLPSTMVIDPQGRIAALVLGQITTPTLVGLVDDVERES